MRALESQGKLNLSGTKIIALTAINESEYDHLNDQSIFDYFRKHTFLLFVKHHHI